MRMGACLHFGIAPRGSLVVWISHLFVPSWCRFESPFGNIANEDSPGKGNDHQTLIFQGNYYHGGGCFASCVAAFGCILRFPRLFTHISKSSNSKALIVLNTRGAVWLTSLYTCKVYMYIMYNSTYIYIYMGSVQHHRGLVCFRVPSIYWLPFLVRIPFDFVDL